MTFFFSEGRGRIRREYFEKMLRREKIRGRKGKNTAWVKTLRKICKINETILSLTIPSKKDPSRANAREKESRGGSTSTIFTWKKLSESSCLKNHIRRQAVRLKIRHYFVLFFILFLRTYETDKVKKKMAF